MEGGRSGSQTGHLFMALTLTTLSFTALSDSVSLPNLDIREAPGMFPPPSSPRSHVYSFSSSITSLLFSSLESLPFLLPLDHISDPHAHHSSSSSSLRSPPCSSCSSPRSHHSSSSLPHSWLPMSTSVSDEVPHSPKRNVWSCK